MNYVYLRHILHCTTSGCAVLREHPVVLLRKGTDGGGFYAALLQNVGNMSRSPHHEYQDMFLTTPHVPPFLISAPGMTDRGLAQGGPICYRLQRDGT